MKHKFSINHLTLACASLLLVAGLSSCGERENVKEHTRGFEPTINYYHDCRTGLCFAEIALATNYLLSTTKIKLISNQQLKQGLIIKLL
jgi:hypothetical protein